MTAHFYVRHGTRFPISEGRPEDDVPSIPLRERVGWILLARPSIAGASKRISQNADTTSKEPEQAPLRFLQLWKLTGLHPMHVQEVRATHRPRRARHANEVRSQAAGGAPEPSEADSERSCLSFTATDAYWKTRV